MEYFTTYTNNTFKEIKHHKNPYIIMNKNNRTSWTGKWTQGHGQQKGDSWGEGALWGINDNGKNTRKITFLKNQIQLHT